MNTYDADNRVVSSTLGNGSSNPATTLTSYDPNGNAFCTVSANAYAAGSTTYQCPTWQVAWIATPPSPSSLYSTTPSSSQANNVTTAFFNTDGTEVQTTNPDVQTSVTAVDADQRTYCTSDPVNVSTWLTANPSGTYPYLCPSMPPTSASTGSTTGYDTTIIDAAGRTLSTTDQVGDTTAYTYDAAGNQLTVTDPRGKVTTNCYYWESGTGQCAASAPVAGGSYDDLYSTTTPSTSADPSGETTSYTYYPGDSADTITTPAGTSTDSYDANLDLTGVSYSGTASGYATPANQSYTYFADGSRHAMVDASGTTTYTEDANDDITQQQLTAGSGTGLSDNTVGYSYYTTGVLASTTYPSYSGHSSPTVDYDYDATGAMTSEEDWLGDVVGFSHDADGNPTAQANDVSTSYPNGTSSTSFSYDNADEPTQASSTLNCSGSSGTLTQSFTGSTGSRNADDQLTEATDSYSGSCAGPSSIESNYSYDQAGRVVYQGTTAQGSNPANIGYDASGDPTTISNHASSGGSLDTYTQTFDNAGEVTVQSPISGSGGSSSTYSYDTLGDQRSTVNGSTTTTESYDQLGQMASTATSSSGSTYLYTGDGLEAARYASPTWGSTTDIDSTNALYSVSCPTISFCAAVDTSGRALTYNGSTWSAALTIGSVRINSVSCPTSSFCEAVDNSGDAFQYNGTSWTETTGIDGTKALNSVSCPSTSFCMAVDNSGNALSWTASSGWSSATSIDSTEPINGVSCSNSSFCVAVANLGKDVIYTGSWGSATTIDGTNTLEAVSCPASTFCETVDAAGNALKYNGTSWSSATSIDGTNVLNSVSCTISGSCAAVDASGDALTYRNSTWSTASDIDGSNTLEAVSCVNFAVCVAVDGSGNAQWYSGSENVQLSWDTNESLAQILSDGTNDYLYGPTGEPVEQISLSSSTPTYLTYSPSNDTWLATTNSGSQLAFWGYDAFGNLSFGTPDSPFGYAGQYQDTGTVSSGFDNMRARWYQSQTGEFTTRDADFASTDTAYTYAGDDPVNGSDPSGLCVSLFNVVCVGGGSVTSTVSFRFDPGAAANATVNIGRGASFGLSNTIANWISPGASCTVSQNGIDQLIGAAATTVASLGVVSAVESEEVTGGAVQRLVVGGGRAFSLEGLPGDVSLNVDFAASPNVVGDIGAAPFQSGSFSSVYFERVPFQAFTGGNDAALSEAARLLQPGGELVIETGPAAPVSEIVQNLQELGFQNIFKEEPSFLRIVATYGGGAR